MRNPERISRIMKQIEEIWNANPDLRFGQLLINLGLIEDNFNTWITEDDVLEKHLKKVKKQWIKTN